MTPKELAALKRRLRRAESLLALALRRLDYLDAEETGPDPIVRAIRRFLTSSQG